jgi:hypothetical protein
MQKSDDDVKRPPLSTKPRADAPAKRKRGRKPTGDAKYNKADGKFDYALYYRMNKERCVGKRVQCLCGAMVPEKQQGQHEKTKKHIDCAAAISRAIGQ